MNGHASRIVVTLEADGRTISVADNGRGIPVDVHPKTGKSALEVIFTTLHAGGKFDNDAYKVAGGLHGVGASVVNALSKSLVAQVRRDGLTYTQQLPPRQAARPGRAGRARAGHGHDRHLHPRPGDLPRRHVRRRADRRAPRGQDVPEQGPGDPVRRPEGQERASSSATTAAWPTSWRRSTQAKGDQRVAPLPFVLEREGTADGLRCHLALAWTEATDEDVRSFVNTIPTRDGGTHEQGMREAVHAAVKWFMEAHDLVKKGIEIKREDILEGLTAVLSVCVHEPQFQGQTKGRLNNPEVRALVESMVRPRLRGLPDQEQERRRRDRRAGDPGGQGPRGQPRGRLAGPPQDGDQQPAEPPRQAPRLRQHQPRGVRAVHRRGRLAPAGRPSRGATATIQAILPLKGKVLNAEQAGKAKVLDNKELTDIVSALGCGMDDQYDPARLRYGKVILLTDADSDGHHIATLLLTFFYRHLPGLLHDGRVYLACPPLYKITWGQETLLGGRRRHPRPHPRRSSPRTPSPTSPASRAWARCPRTLLYETTLDPARRRLLRVLVPDDDRAYTEHTVTGLMGKEPEARFKFIMAEAYTAKDIDIKRIMSRRGGLHSTNSRPTGYSTHGPGYPGKRLRAFRDSRKPASRPSSSCLVAVAAVHIGVSSQP